MHYKLENNNSYESIFQVFWSQVIALCEEQTKM